MGPPAGNQGAKVWVATGPHRRAGDPPLKKRRSLTPNKGAKAPHAADAPTREGEVRTHKPLTYNPQTQGKINFKPLEILGMLIARVDAMPMEMLSLGNCTYQGKLSNERQVDLRQLYGEFKQEEGRQWLEADPRRKQYLADQRERVARETNEANKQTDAAKQTLEQGYNLALQDVVDAVCPLASQKSDSHDEEDEDPLFRGRRG